MSLICALQAATALYSEPDESSPHPSTVSPSVDWIAVSDAVYFVKQLAIPTLRKKPLPVPFPARKTPAVRRYQPTQRHNHEVSICSHRRANLPSPYSNTRCTTATEPSQTAHRDTVPLLLQSGLHFTHLPYTCGRHVPEGCVNVRLVGRTATRWHRTNVTIFPSVSGRPKSVFEDTFGSATGSFPANQNSR